MQKFIIGFIILEKMRIPGVLQRFAITYLIVASTGLLFTSNASNEKQVSLNFFFGSILQKKFTNGRILEIGRMEKRLFWFICMLATMDCDFNISWGSSLDCILLANPWLSNRLFDLNFLDSFQSKFKFWNFILIGYLGPAGLADNNTFSGKFIYLCNFKSGWRTRKKLWRGLHWRCNWLHWQTDFGRESHLQLPYSKRCLQNWSLWPWGYPW